MDRSLEGNLGSSAYVVLGLTMQHKELTPYGLKQRIASSVGYFWEWSHPQIYQVTERLHRRGLLKMRQEHEGRRRKLYSVTRAGRSAFHAWLKMNEHSHSQVRDLALLKLYFGTFAEQDDLLRMARQQIEAHNSRLATYESIPMDQRVNEFAQYTLDMGSEFERMAVKFWSDVANKIEMSEKIGPT